MKHFTYKDVTLTNGFLAEKEKLNRDVTINAVYDRFDETGRIGAFDFNTDAVHYFWDSDVAKWIEGASYIIAKYPNAELEQKIEHIIDCIEEHQGEDGYFNIWYTVKEPEGRWRKRATHELYCAGHLFEAAVAYAEATGKERFLGLMEKYADYIYKVFVEEDSAEFSTPGHEEIELALIRMYRYTGKKKFLDLAAHFINLRGVAPKDKNAEQYPMVDFRESPISQSHLPVREQKEAVGHSVRAGYLYTAMADLVKETGDLELKAACDALYEDITMRKMYVTGGIGSFYHGETFSKPYDLPNAEAYTETCAGIGLMFFCQRMQTLANNATYADTIERVFYNGTISGLSLSGDSFFYENPLEITLAEHFSNEYGRRRFPITQRKKYFTCSCCPPNLNRLLPRLCEYVYGIEGDMLYINQFAGSILESGDIRCEMTTNYPVDGKITLRAEGVKKLAIRIPAWCAKYTISKPYTIENGYAIVENDGEIAVEFDMTPFAMRSNSKVVRDVGKLCVQMGPVVYCAESVDNGENLHSFAIPANINATAKFSEEFDLNTLVVDAFRYVDSCESLYTRADAEQTKRIPTKLKMIPYYAFANRGETDMLVWFKEY